MSLWLKSRVHVKLKIHSVSAVGFVDSKIKNVTKLILYLALRGNVKRKDFWPL